MTLVYLELEALTRCATGRINLTHTAITPDAARRIVSMPGLTPEAKSTGLYSAGYRVIADQVGRGSSSAHDRD